MLLCSQVRDGCWRPTKCAADLQREEGGAAAGYLLLRSLLGLRRQLRQNPLQRQRPPICQTKAIQLQPCNESLFDTSTATQTHTK